MNDHPPCHTPRVLLVEDNLINQEVVRAMLDERPFELAVVEDGREALALLAQEAVDLVLMDCHLPGLDGYETTQAIRAAEAARGASPVPVIAVTANAGLSDRTRCLASGMNDYLSKPFELRQLLDMLDRWLGTRSADTVK